MYHFCYDDKWRIVGTWRGTDTDPKELFIYHNAGVAGYGGSSYIDSVVLRDRRVALPIELQTLMCHVYEDRLKVKP